MWGFSWWLRSILAASSLRPHQVLLASPNDPRCILGGSHLVLQHSCSVSAAQVTLYQTLGLHVSQLGQHRKALGAAAADNATLLRWITDGNAIGPEFSAAANTVKNLLEGSDDDARTALRSHDAQILPNGVIQ